MNTISRLSLRSWPCTVALALTVCMSSALPTVGQTVPQVTKIQGYLSDTSGASPVPANGLHSIQFEVYDALVAGTLITSVGPLSVNVSDGLYDVDLPLAATKQDQKKEPRCASKGICYIAKHDVYLITGPTGNDTRVYNAAKRTWTSLLGGDIYATLRDRSEKAKSRFSKERSPDKALTERKRCLTKLQQDGMIPAEVMAEINLADLPSPEEIKAKAEKIAALKAAQEK